MKHVVVSLVKSLIGHVGCLLLMGVPLIARSADAAELAPRTLRMVFGGDVMLDGGPGHAIAQGRDPFADFASFLQDADLAVCNLECTLAETGQPAAKDYTFLAKPMCLPILKRHFDAVSVANNHALDFGRPAFLRELTLLESAGLGHFGGGRDRREARRPLVLERNGLRVALLGYNDMVPRNFAAGAHRPGTAWLVEADVIADIQRARQTEHVDFVIPFLHWGEELECGPRAEQRALARRLIDAGADAVVGGHAHVTQTVVYYRGHPIIYSLGNFVFDYFPVDPPVFTGWLVRLTLCPGKPVDLETMVLEIDLTGIPHPSPVPAPLPSKGSDQ